MRARLFLAAALAALAGSAVAAAAAAADTLPATPPFQVGVQLTSGARLAPGLFFIDPHQVVDDVVTGPEIIDSQGRVVWYYPLPAGESASNFQVQLYHGQPVLTWWQGSGDNPAFGAFAPGIGQGEDVVMNDHYQIIKTIPTTSDFTPDTHEFYITPEGNALITGYRTVPNVDLTSVGGSADGTVIDSLAREVNLDTGKVLLDWSALAHVPLTNSYALPLFGSSPWDFFHINSISTAPDGNLLISSRHTDALYGINPRTGNIVWTLGGKQSSFTMGPGASFAWQHDSRFVSPDEIQLFDDEEGTPFPATGPQSRAIWLHLDYRTHTATLTRQIIQLTNQPETGSQGSVQTLPNGHVIVGWGSAGTFSEYDPAGNLLLDDSLAPPTGTVTLPNGQTVPNAWSTYRVFKEQWTGRPASPPVATVQSTSTSELTVSAAWNGATQVSRWLVLAGPNRFDLGPVALTAWNGLVTPIAIAANNIRDVRVIALDQRDRPIGASDTTPVGS